MDDDGNLSVGFEVYFVSWDERSGFDEIEVGGVESRDDPSI